MEWEIVITSIIVPLIASGIGAFIAIYSSDRSISQTLRAQEKHDGEHQKEIIQGVLRAIYVELNVIRSEINPLMVLEAWDYFEQSQDSWEEDKVAGTVSKKDRPYFHEHFPASVDLSIIYRSNANLIGHIKKPPHLRERIVKNYTLLHTLLDSYRTNNMYLDQYQEARSKGNTKSAEMFRSRLQELAPILKGSHDFVSTSMFRLIKRIEREMPELKDEYFSDDSE